MYSLLQLIVVLYCTHFVACNVKLISGRNQREAPECSLIKDTGDVNCNENMTKYYFDLSSGECKEFKYTGCGGNLNNFFSLERCNSRCVCSYPKDNGRGPRQFRRYYFNQETEKCQWFVYRGANGNANRFASLNKCQSVCERSTQRSRCLRRPDVGTDCNNNSTKQFFYDKHCDCCRKFTYLGCDGNRNRFSTKRQCEQTCRLESETSTQAATSTQAPTTTGATTSQAPATTQTLKPEFCFYQRLYGDCDGNVTRYYYNNVRNKCMAFTYSGCGGNANKFLTRKLCKKICDIENTESPNLSTTTVTDKPTTTLSSTTTIKTTTNAPSTTKAPKPELCFYQKVYGDCNGNMTMYFYNAMKGRCIAFTYSGCGGNANRFLTRNMCRKVCDTESPNLSTTTASGTTSSSTVTESQTTTKKPNFVLPLACRLQPSNGFCIFNINQFYYDAQAKACRSALWTACGGNLNRFSSPDECVKKCIPQ